MANQEKFKTMIGGQALIEGIMMRGPEKDAVVVRTNDGLNIETKRRKIHAKNSVLRWPLIRGVISFFDAQITGVKALMRSADFSMDDIEQEESKVDQWLEKKLGQKKSQDVIVALAVVLGLAMSIGLFFVLPMFIGSLFDGFVHSILLLNLIEGAVRIVIFIGYIFLSSRLKDMRRVFSYHGAEHKTIRCYEAGLELTVENVRAQSRRHPRCGTSFLLVVMILSILLFSVASSLLLTLVPALAAMKGQILYRVIMIAYKLLLLPLVVALAYEINRWVGRHDNFFTAILTAPGLWFQNFTTNEPDDSMIEVGIEALKAVLPEQEGTDAW